MSDDAQSTAPADAPAEPQGPEPQANDQPRDDEGRFTQRDIHEVREEAKKYRLRLRDTEAQVSALQERVDRHDRAAVERLAGERLNDASDIWLVHSIDDFRAEDGSLDEEKVGAALDQLAQTRSHWLKRMGGFDGGVRRAVQTPPSFGDALKESVTGQR